MMRAHPPLIPPTSPRSAPVRAGLGQRAIPGAPGFTMMELLVAVAVVSLVLLGIVGVFIVSHTNVDHGGRVTRATTYGHQKVEELRNTAFGLLANGTDVPETAFTRTWTVNVTGASPARMAGVRVDVSFRNPTGRPATVQIQSEIAE